MKRLCSQPGERERERERERARERENGDLASVDDGERAGSI